MCAQTILVPRPALTTRVAPLRGAACSTSIGEKTADVFYFTVTHGRAEKGMPNWKGVLDDETLWTIFAFLETVQSEP